MMLVYDLLDDYFKGGMYEVRRKGDKKKFFGK